MNLLSSKEPRYWDESVPEVIITRIPRRMICSFVSEESNWLDGSMKKFGTAESINNALVSYYQRKKSKISYDHLHEWQKLQEYDRWPNSSWASSEGSIRFIDDKSVPNSM